VPWVLSLSFHGFYEYAARDRFQGASFGINVAKKFQALSRSKSSEDNDFETDKTLCADRTPELPEFRRTCSRQDARLDCTS
jgi:hypothetical protein